MCTSTYFKHAVPPSPHLLFSMMSKSKSQVSVGRRAQVPSLEVETSSARAPSSQLGADGQTNSGTQNRRVDRWSEEKDHELVRLYFLDRKVDGKIVRGYRKRIYEKFKQTFPETGFREQNVGES